MKSPLHRFRTLLFCLSLLSTTLFGCSLLPTDGDEVEQVELDAVVTEESADEEKLVAPVAPPLASSGNNSQQDNDDNSMAGSDSMANDNSMSGQNSMTNNNSMSVGVDTSAGPTGVMGNGGPFTPLGDSQEDMAIAIAANYQEMAWHISHYRWSAEAYFDEGEATWWIDFWSVDSTGEQEEWLAWAGVDLVTSELIESYVPRELTAEEFQVGRTLVEELVFNDAAVLAAVGGLEPIGSTTPIMIVGSNFTTSQCIMASMKYMLPYGLMKMAVFTLKASRMRLFWKLKSKGKLSAIRQ